VRLRQLAPVGLSGQVDGGAAAQRARGQLAVFFARRGQLRSSTLFPYTTLFRSRVDRDRGGDHAQGAAQLRGVNQARRVGQDVVADRQSTRLNSSHVESEYAVVREEQDSAQRFRRVLERHVGGQRGIRDLAGRRD